LWLRWRAGDASAGDLLFRRHFDAVYRFFAGKGLAEVDELVQQTFVACLEGNARGREVDSFRPWLFGIARHVLIARFRARPAFDAAVSSLEDLAPTASVVLGTAEEHKLLVRALRRIKLDAQIILELHYWEGLGTRQLATVLEVPEGTAKGQLRRARLELRATLAELASDDAVRDSTLADLDRWIAGIRQQVPIPPARDR
jgi:RNA polymerase sigma factor (sigma-70 family)